VPNFLLALIILYLAFRYFDASIGGLFSPQYEVAAWSWAKVWDLMLHLPLPALILALAGTAQLIRIMRANLLDELRRPIRRPDPDGHPGRDSGRGRLPHE
jgi:peptide/nickel transport system permease protein